MKNLFSIVISFCLLSINAYAWETYVLAPKLKIESARGLNTVNTEVKLSYELPCWTEYAGVIKKTVVLGDMMNPRADTEVVLGVLLKGDKTNPCMGSVKQEVILNLSTFNVEGAFKGLKLIEKI